jgi:putative membrane protein
MIMKKRMIYFLLVPGIAAFFACSNTDRNDNNTYADNDKDRVGTEKDANEHNEAKFDNKAENDADFVVKAVKQNLDEIALCDLAMQRATHNEIKELAKTLNAAHTKANNELTRIAKEKSITIPVTTDVQSDDYKSLNDKNGNDFDKAYYDKVVAMHKDAVDRYEKAAKDAQDADIRNFAAAQLPTLRAHLDRAMNDQKLAESWHD